MIGSIFLLLVGIHQAVSTSEPILIGNCDVDFGASCSIECPNGNYQVNDDGCRICACAQSEPSKPIVECEKRQCRSTCSPSGYKLDENGCSTCTCLSKSEVQCSRVICRMFCQNGFKRDENGCEYCSCNELPEDCPMVDCQNSCKTYRKDSIGCQTCDCDEPKTTGEIQCSSQTCRMYCIYGFRRDERGCEICECDWEPISENIQCSERISCPGTRVCNTDLKLCEKVDPDRVNWFVYNFELKNSLLADRKFAETFKNGLIHNIAKKYDLRLTQITVSAVDPHGETSFQIMPFFNENLDQFESKMNQIDLDLNSHEFRSVLPAIVRATEDDVSIEFLETSWLDRLKNRINSYTSTHSRLIAAIFALILLGLVVLCVLILIKFFRCPVRYSSLSDSKSPIYDAPYQKTATEEDHYQPVQAADGTTYVIVPSDEPNGVNDKRALV